MDILMRFWATLLFFGGALPFCLLGAVLVGVVSMGPLRGDSDDQVTKTFMLYVAFALAGLLSASGGVLWAVVNVAYPRKTKKPSTKDRVASDVELVE